MATQRRFRAQETTIYSNLQATMRKVGATSLRVKERDLLNAKDVEAQIVFDRAGRRYVIRCKRWPVYLDNLRAAERTIYYLYHALSEYGAVTSEQVAEAFSTIFSGFEATPNDTVLMLGDGSEAWYEVLAVKPEATRAEIVNAFRSLARVHHPDVGGTPADFQRVRRAYEQGLEARGGR